MSLAHLQFLIFFHLILLLYVYIFLNIGLHTPHFMKIRYYGILGNKNKKKKLLKCKILTRTKIYKKKELPTLELLKKVLGKDFNLCPQCKKGHMLIPNTT